MSGLDGALCVGKSWLFDSTHRSDQEAAAELCRACPVRDACAVWAAEVKRLAAYSGGPEGTWAGKGFGRDGHPTRDAQRTRQTVASCGTDSGYFRHRRYDEPPCAQCRKAHAAATRRASRKIA